MMALRSLRVLACWVEIVLINILVRKDVGKEGGEFDGYGFSND